MAKHKVMTYALVHGGLVAADMSDEIVLDHKVFDMDNWPEECPVCNSSHSIRSRSCEECDYDEDDDIKTMAEKYRRWLDQGCS
jgi:transposase-like protein